PAIRHAWPLVLILSAIQGVGQLLLMFVSPVLATFLAAAAALVALYPLSRWKRYAEPAEDIRERPAMRERASHELNDRKAPMGLGMAFLPYLVLTVVALGVITIGPIDRALGSFSAGMAFPAVETGYGVSNGAAAPYSPFAPLTHPGTFLLVTSLVTWLVYRSRGFYEAWSTGDDEQGMLRDLLDEAVPAA